MKAVVNGASTVYVLAVEVWVPRIGSEKISHLGNPIID